MTDNEETEQSETAPALRLKRLLCKRTGEQIKPEEHECCPYCFGRLSEIEKGYHEAFCDYREGVDPRQFGFPAGDERTEQG